MSEAKHTPAVFAAARVLHEIDGRESMEVCDVKSADYFTDDAEAVLRAAGLPDLLAAARPMVAMTFAEAREKEHHGMRFMYCQHDALNPCWDTAYSPTGWGEHGPGKHWGGGDACPECNLRAAIFKATGSAE